ncbi:hypothetical protein DICSQDRAFT_63909, partial [Dichomitus squalens LYAD-421 SS1]
EARWSLFMSRFNFFLKHRPGKIMQPAGPLSRRPDYKEVVSSDNIAQCYTLCQRSSGTPSDTALTPPDLRTCLRIVTYIPVSISFPVSNGGHVYFPASASGKTAFAN